MTAPIVIKVGGAVLDDAAAAAKLASDIAAVAKSERIVLVHGGQGVIDRAFEAAGIAVEKIDGLRVSPAEHMGLVSGAIDAVNAELVAFIKAAGVEAVGMGLGDAGFECQRTANDRLGAVGTVVGGAGERLLSALDAGVVPVVGCVGMGANGEPLNVNADDAAAGVGARIGARTIVLLTDVSGVRTDGGELIEHLDSEDAEGLIGARTVTGGMVAKVRAAALAADTSGRTVVIASWAHVAGVLAGSEPCTRVSPSRSRRRAADPHALTI